MPANPIYLQKPLRGPLVSSWAGRQVDGPPRLRRSSETAYPEAAPSAPHGGREPEHQGIDPARSIGREGDALRVEIQERSMT